jgi:methionyl-tRNA formyltransferase
MSQPIRIVYAGTPGFAVPPLEALINTDFRPIAVFTQPDRPAGRGRKLQVVPVKQLALRHDIPVLQPTTLRQDADIQSLRNLSPDLLVVVAYGLILPRPVLDIPTHGCWNIHASLLPRWRGAAPIQRAIEAGDQKTGVSIMRIAEGLDTGPLYHEVETAIEPNDTSASLHDRLAALGADALLHCLRQLQAGVLGKPTPQADEQAVYAAKITKAEAELDWHRPAAELERKVRAFNPWPVTWFQRENKRFRVWSASVESGSGTPGSLLSAGPNGIDIATADGVLRILELQAEGGRRMSAGDFLNAHRIS